MQVVFLGLPGAGKGTQAANITQDFGIPHIATGDMFRSAIAAGTPLGKEVQGYLDAGLLVPDELTIRVVRERLQAPDAQNGFLLDGFPRTQPQAVALDEMLAEISRPLTHVLYLVVSQEELLSRLTGRRVCKKCGASYHVIFNPSRVENVCDRCGGELITRPDDEPKAVAVRLRENMQRTEELAAFYAARGLLAKIDGEQPIGHVYDEIWRTLRGETK
ncbi:adenylate kinase [Sulfoacidibacillus thermotolerans]|uniref:Adenylate kinase n=1 Tax=Sulfoacidibacillus thermotolerans TaxID=1765684 RepID=A0A2U3DBI3_SULT2|nr:adenylate kinase [Sulfoacidibacillus thermotolerans]PWI58637.1 adenylate kinase [Sulfoacidibacillus thermotolerans]